MLQEFSSCHSCDKELGFENSCIYEKKLSCLECMFVKQNIKKLKLTFGSKMGKKRRRRLKFLEKDPFCFYCRRKLKLNNSTLDHKVPKSKGGKGHSNYVLSCYKCNQLKGSKNVKTFLSEKV